MTPVSVGDRFAHYAEALREMPPVDFVSITAHQDILRLLLSESHETPERFASRPDDSVQYFTSVLPESDITSQPALSADLLCVVGTVACYLEMPISRVVLDVDEPLAATIFGICDPRRPACEAFAVTSNFIEIWHHTRPPRPLHEYVANIRRPAVLPCGALLDLVDGGTIMLDPFVQVRGDLPDTAVMPHKQHAGRLPAE